MDGQGVLVKQQSTDFDQPPSLHRDITKLVAVGDQINTAIDVTPGLHPGGQWNKEGAALTLMRMWASQGVTDISALTVAFKLFAFPRPEIVAGSDPAAVTRNYSAGLLLAALTVKMGGLPFISARHPVTGLAITNTNFYEMSVVTVDTFRIDPDIVRLIGSVDDGRPMMIRVDMNRFSGLYVEPTAALNITRIVIDFGRMM